MVFYGSLTCLLNLLLQLHCNGMSRVKQLEMFNSYGCCGIQIGISFSRSKLHRLLHFETRTRSNCNTCSLFSRQRYTGGFVFWICPTTEQQFLVIFVKQLQYRFDKFSKLQMQLFCKIIYRPPRMNFYMVHKERADAQLVIQKSGAIA